MHFFKSLNDYSYVLRLTVIILLTVVSDFFFASPEYNANCRMLNGQVRVLASFYYITFDSYLIISFIHEFKIMKLVLYVNPITYSK